MKDGKSNQTPKTSAKVGSRRRSRKNRQRPEQTPKAPAQIRDAAITQDGEPNWDYLARLLAIGTQAAMKLALLLWACKEFCTRTGLTQRKIALRLVTSPSTVSQLMAAGEYLTGMRPEHVAPTPVPLPEIGGQLASLPEAGGPLAPLPASPDITMIADLGRALRRLVQAVVCIVLGREAETRSDVERVVLEARETFPPDIRAAVEAETLTPAQRLAFVQGLPEKEALKAIPGLLTRNDVDLLVAPRPSDALHHALGDMPLVATQRDALELFAGRARELAKIESAVWHRTAGECAREDVRQLKKSIDLALTGFVKRGSTRGRKPDESPSAMVLKAAQRMHVAMKKGHQKAALAELRNLLARGAALERELNHEPELEPEPKPEPLAVRIIRIQSRPSP